MKKLIRKLKLNKISGYGEIDGWLTEEEALGLYSIARKIKRGGKVVEIGSWKGKSTVCIAKGLKAGKLYAIDPFNAAGDPDSIAEYERKKGKKPLLLQFKENLKKNDVFGKVIPLKGYSKDFVGKVGDVDFLFIDGNHTKKDCKFDFQSYSPKVKIGGYIGFHDFYAERKDLGPTWVVNNLVLKSDKYEFFGQFDSLWVCKVIK